MCPFPQPRDTSWPKTYEITVEADEEPREERGATVFTRGGEVVATVTAGAVASWSRQ